MKKLKARLISRTITVTEVTATVYDLLEKDVLETTVDVIGYSTDEEIECYLKSVYFSGGNYKLVDFSCGRVKAVKATLTEEYFYQLANLDEIEG